MNQIISVRILSLYNDSLKLKNEIKKKVILRLKENNVKRAAFFGSITRTDFNDSSDIDIIVEFKGKKSLLDLLKLKHLLEDELGRKIDLITYNSIDPLMEKYILSDIEKIFY